MDKYRGLTFQSEKRDTVNSELGFHQFKPTKNPKISETLEKKSPFWANATMVEADDLATPLGRFQKLVQ